MATATGISALNAASRLSKNADTPDDDEMLTPDELAAEWKIAPATLADWRVQGGDRTPPFIKMGKLVRYVRGPSRRWLEARMRRSTSDPGQAAA